MSPSTSVECPFETGEREGSGTVRSRLGPSPVALRSQAGCDRAASVNADRGPSEHLPGWGLTSDRSFRDLSHLWGHQVQGTGLNLV